MMFKKLITLFAFMASSLAFSQVGIQTQTPHASSDLELGSTNKALYLNRVANPLTDIANPQPGMVLYDTTLHCVRVYQGNPPAWSQCLGLGLGASEGSIDSFNCNAAIFAPASATQGVAYSGTLSIPYIGGDGGTYPEDDFTVDGLRFHLVEGSYNTGNGTLTYQVTGTPAASGSISVDISQNGGSCTGLSLPVNAPVGTVTALTCGSAVFSPATATVGTGYIGTLTIPYTGGNGGTYTAQSLSQNGLTFSLTAGNFSASTGNLVYNITGTPLAAGATAVNVTAGGQSCNGLSLPVNAVTPTNPVGTGSLSGRTCFDVVEIFVSDDCGTIASRTPQKADFSQGSVNTQTYTFTPTGTVSNVRFVYVNTNGQVIQSLTGGNPGNSITAPVNATVVYYNNLNAAATGKSRDQALTADIYVIYNPTSNNSGIDVQLKLTARVQDCACCGAYVAPNVWKQFMCHNLGADITADPFTPSWKLNGAYIQWGKRGPNITGDSSIDWKTASNNGSIGFVAAPTATDPNAGAVPGFGQTPTLPANSWNAGTEAAPVKHPTNDPCPAGYRIPTMHELMGVATNNYRARIGTWTSSTTNYSSAVNYGLSASATTLMLPTAGIRDGYTGAMNGFSSSPRGRVAAVWSSTTAGNYPPFNGSINFQEWWLDESDGRPDPLASGFLSYEGKSHYAIPIRCIAE